MRILVVGDVRVCREELARALGRAARQAEARASPCGPAVTGEIATHHTEIVLVDMTAERSLAVIEQVASRHPHVKIVALGAPERAESVITCAEAGVCAFVSADSSIADVVTALRAVEQDDWYCSPRVAAALLGRLRHVSLSADTEGLPLTAREIEITRLIELGFTNKEIAGELSIALPTVKNHVHHILEKLGVSRRAEAVARLRTADVSRD